MQENGGDIFAWLFLLVIFLVLLGVPIWLMVRHHKRSKIKLDKLKQEQSKETSKEARMRRRNHNVGITGTLCSVAGILIGTRLLNGGFIDGLILAVILGSIGSYVASKIWEDK